MGRRDARDHATNLSDQLPRNQRTNAPLSTAIRRTARVDTHVIEKIASALARGREAFPIADAAHPASDRRQENTEPEEKVVRRSQRSKGKYRYLELGERDRRNNNDSEPFQDSHFWIISRRDRRGCCEEHSLLETAVIFCATRGIRNAGKIFAN